MWRTSKEHRFDVFRTNIAQYAAWNAEPGQTAVYGPNAFSDLTKDEFAAQFLVPTGLNASGIRRAAPAVPMRRAAVPQNFITPYVTPARQQGQCGSCWAFTTAAVLEGAYLKATKKTVVVSPQNLLDCSNYGGQSNWDGCQGYNAVNMISELADDGKNGGGVALESQYPYQERMGQCRKSLSKPGEVVVKNYFTEKFNEQEGSSLYSRLMQYSALGIAINAGYLQGYSSGIVRGGSGCRYTQQGYDAPDHAVTLAGWGEENGVKYWLIKNSWGPNWGEPKDFRKGGQGQGFFRIVRGAGACHLTDEQAVGVVTAGGSTPEPTPASSSKGPTPDPGPQPCQPKSKRAVCGSRQCGNVDNGCGTSIACGYCRSGHACSANGRCGAVDDHNDWAQVFPQGASGDFTMSKGSNGVTIGTATNSHSEKRAAWTTSSQWMSDSWTSFSVGVSAGAAGIVGIGMRMGQQDAPLNGIAWKIVIPRYNGGSTAPAQLQQCFFYSYDQCSAVGRFNFRMNAVNNFTINFVRTYNWYGEELIAMVPFLNGRSLTGNNYYTIQQSYFPALGNAFIVASGASKTFTSPRLITRTTVRVAMRSCHSTDDWADEVVRILRIPRAFVADVQGQTSAGSCGAGLYNAFNVTLLDANTTTGFYSQAAAGIAAFNQLAYSNALASQLVSTVSGGGLANMGVVGASASVVLPEVVGTAVAGTIAGAAAATGGLTTGAIVGIAVGASVGALIVASAVAAGVVVAVKRHNAGQSTSSAEVQLENKKVAHGVDVMSNKSSGHQSLTGHEHRFGVFRRNVAEYASWNAEPGQTAFYGPNAFSDLTKDEFAAMFLVPTGLNTSEIHRAAPLAPMRRAAVPQSFTTPYMTPARQQGSCGSCWAFAAAAVLESAYLKATRKTVVVSTQNILDCVNYGQRGWDGCQGFNAIYVLSELAQQGSNGGGVALESEYPYQERMGQCRRSFSQPSEVAVKYYFAERMDEAEGSSVYSRLMQYGPLGIALNAGYLQGYRSGIVKHGNGCRYTQQGQDSADHAVTLAGWGEENGVKYWLIKNSWGVSWGEPKDFRQGGRGEGYFRLQRGVRACHVTDDRAVGAVVAGSTPDPTPDPTPASSTGPTPDPDPQPCRPKSQRTVCGSRQCGNVDNGCGTSISCGYCSSGQACSAAGVCAAVDDHNDWAQVFPEGASGDFRMSKGSNGVTIATATTSMDEKRAAWTTSSQWASDSWTSFSVGVSAGAAGIVGIGMRMGQQDAPLNGIAWKIVIPRYNGGSTASAQLQQCFFYSYDQCSAVGRFNFRMNAVNNFTINFALMSDDNGEQLIAMVPFLNGRSLTGNNYYTIQQSYFPALGNAFVVASGASKTFTSPRLITRTTVRVAMRSCHSTDDWADEVVRILRIPRAFVADVQGQTSAGSCGAGLYNAFNVTLLDANTTTGFYSQAAAGIAAFNQLAYSNALASQLVSTVSGGGLANMGVVGASASVVLPEVVGTAVAGTIAGAAAATGGLTTGAIVGIAVGASVGALIVASAVAAGVVVAVKRHNAGQSSTSEVQLGSSRAPRGVDVMSNTGGHQSITGRAPPVA
eukprot:m51a1_g4900 hypothetical protein (1567) ;mRNA; r:140639-148484